MDHLCLRRLIEPQGMESLHYRERLGYRRKHCRCWSYQDRELLYLERKVRCKESKMQGKEREQETPTDGDLFEVRTIERPIARGVVELS